MRVLHINTLSKGGAANAAIRLHHGLIDLGHESIFLTLSAEPNNIKNHTVFPQFSRYGLSFTKRIKNKLGIQPLAGIKRALESNKIAEPIECFSSPNTDYKLAEYINDQIDIDIVNLHWVANFLDYTEFFGQINKPVVWTLHDENPYASYWHYSNDHIQTNEALQIHQENLATKMKAFASFQKQLHIVAPSKWLSAESKNSQALNASPNYHIPYGLDTKIYKPRSEKPQTIDFSKSQFDLTGLFICQSVHNKRKGMHLLIDALKLVSNSINVEFIAVGKVDSATREQFPDNILFTGEISDENELARLYNYADFTLIPSLQDNLPNTMLESLCCGTPVLGTPAGGIPEVVARNNNGLIADGFNPEDLLEIIKLFVESKNDFDRESIARNANKEFGLDVQANAYSELYKSVLS